MRRKCVRSAGVMFALVLAAVLLAPLAAYAQIRTTSDTPRMGADPAAVARDIELRRALAEQLVASREDGRPFDPVERAGLVERLSDLSVEELQHAQFVGGNPLLPGDSSSDLVFVPITPCRVFDTRLGYGGVMNAGVPRNFIVAACGVPYGTATSVVMNLTATAFTGGGWVQATAYLSPMPTASVINYAPGMGNAIANQITMKICDPFVSACAPADITLLTQGAPVHLIADVMGYYRWFGPSTFRRSETNNFVTIPPVGSNVVLNAITFTPRVTGNYLIRGRGYCNVTPNGVRTRIILATGTSAAGAFNGSFDEYGIVEGEAISSGAILGMNYTLERYFALARGATYTFGVYAAKEVGTASANCQGSFVIEGLF